MHAQNVGYAGGPNEIRHCQRDAKRNNFAVRRI